jgi:predicted dehydrogenase
VDIDSVVSIRFAGGAFGSISIMGDFPAWHEEWTLCFERGGMLMRNGKIEVISNDGERIEAAGLSAGGNPDANFVGAILSGDPVESRFEDGLRVIQLTEAAWQSSAKGGAPIRPG